jgi:antibiotic biosynthesis monooxygenase (ABM) superfamily enzyme
VIVYEVNLYPQVSIEAEYRAWLDAHVLEMCALPGFIGAEILERRDPAAPEGELALCVQYRLRDGEALEAYLREHAPRLRADGIARFGDRFRAERRVLAPIARY